jgi:hypothetical protein
MAEVFVEHLVKRKVGIYNWILRFLAVVASVCSVFLFPYLGVFTLTVMFGIIYLCYIVFSNTSIEYEYSFLNGELTIDRILGQRKRKHVATFDLNQTEIVARTNSEDIQSRAKGMRVADFSSGMQSADMCSMIVNGKNGQIHVLFEPDEEMIRAMKYVRPSLIRIDDVKL